ncbi:MAG: alpha/beta fold hydrolase [Myxococcota bacterium]
MLARSRLHAVRFGAGPKVFVGLHGWSGSHRSFEPLNPFIPPDVSFHAVDLPGFGRSPDPSGWDMERFLGPIDESIPPGPVTLVGACGGAVIALFLAVHRPERVERLVMIDPFAFAPWYFGIFDTPLLGPLFYGLSFMNPIGRWLTNQGVRRHRSAETDLIEGFKEVRHASNLAYLRLLVQNSRVDFRRFEAYPGPVDLLRGRRTFPAVAAGVPKWRGVWPHLRDVVIDEAGHLPIFEATGEVARWVFDEHD